MQAILIVFGGGARGAGRHLAVHPGEEAGTTTATPAGRRCIDPFEGGYPVPPLPGQVLPPSPRKRRLAAAKACIGGGRTRAGADESDGRNESREVHGG